MTASSSLIRWSGLAAMLGGVLFAAASIVIASMPRGCMGNECAFREIRYTGAAGALQMLALMLVVAGAVGLAVRARNAGRLGRLGWTGLLVGALGVALLMIGGLIQAAVFNGDFPFMPLFVIPGILALIVGYLLLGIAVLRARVLPRWSAMLLVVGSLTMLGFNDQNAQSLMATPFGIAWMAVGYALWSDSDESAQQPVRVR